jgi:hypothetical protein
MQLKILIFLAGYVYANVVVRNICRAARHPDGRKGKWSAFAVQVLHTQEGE